MKQMLLETIMSEVGSEDKSFETRLLSNGGFMSSFTKLRVANGRLSDWANSHISMDGFSKAFEQEKERLAVEKTKMETVYIAKGILTASV